MKRCAILILAAFVCLLSGCRDTSVFPTAPTFPPTTQATNSNLSSTTVQAATTTVATTIATTTAVQHSSLYIPGVEVGQVISYFNEVCLGAEFVNSGDATLLQKWVTPVRYYIYGSPTDEDLATLGKFELYLNGIAGFPGIARADNPSAANVDIYFCSYDEMIDHLGDNFYGNDGGVTFWYNGDNEIYRATICYRTDIEQSVRNSVILEEIYNGLGPIQDTSLRTDSIIYAGYSTPTALTAVDKLLLELLYHPRIRCGMDAATCETVIRELYY